MPALTPASAGCSVGGAVYQCQKDRIQPSAAVGRDSPNGRKRSLARPSDAPEKSVCGARLRRCTSMKLMPRLDPPPPPATYPVWVHFRINPSGESGPSRLLGTSELKMGEQRRK